MAYLHGYSIYEAPHKGIDYVMIRQFLKKEDLSHFLLTYPHFTQREVMMIEAPPSIIYGDLKYLLHPKTPKYQRILSNILINRK